MSSRILLLEDNEKNRNTLEKAIRKKRVHFHAISQTEVNWTSEGESNTYEDIFEKHLKELHQKEEIGLVISDRDLTRMGTGLSSSIIAAVCDRLAIPVALYARPGRSQGTNSIVQGIESLLPSPLHIELNSGPLSDIAAQIIDIYKGFEQIHSHLIKMAKETQSYLRRGPAASLAKILRKPEFAYSLTLFYEGQAYLKLVNLRHKPSENNEEALRRMAHLLGVWLHNWILRYPGPLLDATASASFLNIDPARFEKTGKVRDLFIDASYQGPFSKSQPRWWRDELLEILAKAGAEDGKDLCRMNGLRVKDCYCHVCGDKAPGYICLITYKPVCDKDSCSVREELPLPEGATQARITRDEFYKAEPWLR